MQRHALVTKSLRNRLGFMVLCELRHILLIYLYFSVDKLCPWESVCVHDGNIRKLDMMVQLRDVNSSEYRVISL